VNKLRNLYSIQLLRAVSVLLVIGYHFNFPFKSGFIGVDIFFVISGYVITESLLRKKTSSLPYDLKKFYLRRINRLYPVFFVVIAITLLFVALFYSPNMGAQQNSIKVAAGTIFFVSNFVVPLLENDYFGALLSDNPFVHTWSLSVEWQFYLIYPIIFLLVIHNSNPLKSKRILKTILIVLILASFFAAIYEVNFNNVFKSIFPIYFATQSRAWEFLIGCFVSLAIPRMKIYLTKYGFGIQLCIVIILILLALNFEVEKNNYFSLLLLPVLLTGMFLYLAKFESHYPKSNVFFVRKLMKFIETVGDMSYSLYLWHWPVIVTIRYLFDFTGLQTILLALLTTFTVSWLTYKAIESKNYFQEMNQKLSFFKLFLSGQVFLILLISSIAFGISRGWWQDWTLTSHKIISKGCDFFEFDRKTCTWHENSSKEKMFLIGDSMSWAIGNSIIDIAKELDFELRVFSRNSCPASLDFNKPENECESWNSKVISEIQSENPKIVIMANSDLYPIKQTAGFGKLVQKLNASKVKVLMILPPPGGDNFSGRRSLLYRPGSENRYRLDDSDRLDLVYQKYNLNLELNDIDFQIFEPRKYLCFHNSCLISNDSKDFYVYGAHLSPFGSQFIYLPLLKQIEMMV
jgi:peptidoglycan/LPS O-acetylase OafA/YrhL